MWGRGTANRKAGAESAVSTSQNKKPRTVSRAGLLRDGGVSFCP
jgi:hypothetical protein